MIILSVDYGDARTGIAVCDPGELLASPVTVLHETWPPKVAKAVADLAREKRAERIVVGDPVNMDGTRGERSKKCRELARMLTEDHGLDTVLMDERLTTVEAHRALNVTNTRGKDRKAVVDAVSAVIILEDYLRQEKNRKG
ncbi:MAG: Holliday junction resolvase RuvX [Clostridia bacterium]|nr:Holliday junction resolvase RuvX [Clostridia bacterium]